MARRREGLRGGATVAGGREVLMVIEGYRSSSELDKSRQQAVPDLRVRTRRAAAKAARIAEVIARGETPDVASDEQALFAAVQTCAYRATARTFRRRPNSAERLCWIERWKTIRDYIVERNLGLVHMMVHRFGGQPPERDDLRGEAFLALMRAVAGYDPWRGVRFTTYACNAIWRSLVHAAKTASKHRPRMPVEGGSWSEPLQQTDARSELYVDRLLRALDENLGELTEREAEILGWRFPLRGESALTLEEIGNAIGVSKERVRQIQKTGLSKLREVLEADPVLQ